MFPSLRKSSASESNSIESNSIGNVDGERHYIMKAFVSNLIKFFLIINSAEMLIVWINIFKFDTIGTALIPQIFCSSFVTALVTTVFFSLNPKKPMGVALRVILYIAFYLVLCVVIMGLGSLFSWFELSAQGILGVALSVAGVFGITAFISYILSRNEANEMTDALRNFKDEE